MIPPAKGKDKYNPPKYSVVQISMWFLEPPCMAISKQHFRL